MRDLCACSCIQLGHRLHGNGVLRNLLSEPGYLGDPGEWPVCLLLTLGLHAHVLATLSVDGTVSIPFVLLVVLPLLLAQAVLPLLLLLLLEHLLHHLLHAQSLSLVFTLDVALDLLLHIHVGLIAMRGPPSLELRMGIPKLLELLVWNQILAFWKVEVEFVDFDFSYLCITFIVVLQVAIDLGPEVFDVQQNIALPLFSDAALLQNNLPWHGLAFDLFAQVSVDLDVDGFHLASPLVISFILDGQVNRLEDHALVQTFHCLNLDLDDEEELRGNTVARRVD